jgi:hypothetical protein
MAVTENKKNIIIKEKNIMQRRGEEKKTHFLIAKLSRRPMPTPPLIEAAIPNIIIIIINSLNHHS